ncbi:phytoene desaturase family protein [Streptomyces flavofungini]|uniref:NAD(P)/FAD-dependent oxidoreductase n=1 Tax=Streptomyces flavofungini TaxID=68200 RepID=A0ABS0X2N6_9ACTN|nr:NAD(P)/FAD-dependent oxidoreductase [Streptomyces flavofungini]MBJ3807447.1 NAD(P)/FAD-dependent oxidoreductase [Streptomyces flavofungini]GHC65483.1 phytoene dehydrogenase [Streptomyces flavofungini]
MARIVVIGAGMGAMTAAARLAVAGHRVVVHERAGTYGGALGRVERDGFGFDTGPALLHLPAVYRDLFVKTGKQPLEDCVELSQVEPAVRHVFADGTTADLPNASRAGVGEALDGALGAGAGARWAAFMNRAREAWDRTRRPLLEEPLWPNWEVLADREPYPSVAQKRLLRRERRAATLAQVAEFELGGEPRLTALLEHFALGHGLDPRTVPASAAVLPYLEQTFGTWSARGGMRALATAVYERCRARRVEFAFGSAVVRIVEKDGRAAGVELADGTVVDADFVVAGVAPGALAGMLSGTPARAPQDVPAQSGLPSRLTVLLALRGARTEDTPHRTVLHTGDRADELDRVFGPPEASGNGDGPGTTHGNGPRPGLPSTPTLTVLRPDDPMATPDAEHEAVTLTAVVPAGAEVTDAAVQRLIARAAAVVPGLDDRLLWHEVRTPAHVAEATGADGGAVPAPVLAAAGGRYLHPANSTAVAGLYAVGGWSHPGGGLPHAGMSGTLAAGLIVEGPEFRGSQ